jgi:hypothetical protein
LPPAAVTASPVSGSGVEPARDPPLAERRVARCCSSRPTADSSRSTRRRLQSKVRAARDTVCALSRTPVGGLEQNGRHDFGQLGGPSAGAGGRRTAMPLTARCCQRRCRTQHAGVSSDDRHFVFTIQQTGLSPRVRWTRSLTGRIPGDST